MNDMDNMSENEMRDQYISMLNDSELQDLQICLLVEMQKRGFIDPTYIGFKTYVDERMKE